MKVDLAAREREDRAVAARVSSTGVPIGSVFDLVNRGPGYAAAIPALIAALPEVTDLWIKQGVVRALATPEARGIAGAPLIAEFLRLPFSGEGTPAQESLKWAIANTLAIVAAPAEFQHLKAILGDSRHGKSREMVALAIAASGVPAAAELLCVSLAQYDSCFLRQ
jgi:hypothetical protein